MLPLTADVTLTPDVTADVTLADSATSLRRSSRANRGQRKLELNFGMDGKTRRRGAGPAVEEEACAEEEEEEEEKEPVEEGEKGRGTPVLLLKQKKVSGSDGTLRV